MDAANHVVANLASAIWISTGWNAILYHYPTLHALADPVRLWISPAVPYGGVAAVLAFLFGTLLPDCDQRKSALGKWLYLPGGHRTWTHSIWLIAGLFALSVPARSFLLLCTCISWIALGAFGHLFWDALSCRGIYWFWPIGRGRKRGRRHLWIYHSGKTSETVTVVCLVLATIALLVLHRYGALLPGLWKQIRQTGLRLLPLPALSPSS